MPDDPPFRWEDVAARLERADRVHDFAKAAEITWAPILKSLQEEQRRMKWTT